MVREHWAVRLRRNLDILPWPCEVWLGCVIAAGRRGTSALAHPTLVQLRPRARKGLSPWFGPQRDSEADEPALVLGQGSHPVLGSEVVELGGVASAARHLEVPVHASHRIPLASCSVGAVPVLTPLLHVAMHVAQAPGVGRGPTDRQVNWVVKPARIGIRKPADLRVLVELHRQGVACVVVGLRPGATCVLPLGLRRQSIG